MNGAVLYAEKKRDRHYHGGFFATSGCCGWKKIVWCLIDAAMIEDLVVSREVLLLTGLIDPLLSLGLPKD
jgi:hypothetical protein